jgi:hypothetical protein
LADALLNGCASLDDLALIECALHVGELRETDFIDEWSVCWMRSETEANSLTSRHGRQ